MRNLLESKEWKKDYGGDVKAILKNLNDTYDYAVKKNIYSTNPEVLMYYEGVVDVLASIINSVAKNNEGVIDV